ncbi:AMP-binding protein [Nocardia aurantiaca]|uniref:AMP-binding protein n=1 Tax=Nocardia aurantiaca TaxID=2675850 RepID=A0A6I3LAE9_9NOCA|nr:AMP-binding protein [Nocardia aurantiaca]MTE16819.1 AMP-binding protein [Nocardia aurantiaca]
MYLTQALHRAVQQTPTSPVTIFGDRIRQWDECADRVSRLAAGLRGLGINSGDRVGILALNSDRYHEFLFASAWAGGVAAPVNVRWSSAEIAFSLVDADVRVQLVDDACVAMVPAIRSRAENVRTVVYCGDGAAPAGLLNYEQLITDHDPVPDTRSGGDLPAAVFYTGGTHMNPALRSYAGRALPHVEVKIVGSTGTELPNGTVGEVVVRGANVMLGYWNRPDETAAAFRDGWLLTGDGGFMDKRGYLFVVDRIKDMIVSGGENVYSAEVENALAKHPAVAACAVIGVPDPDWGERVHAVVALATGQQTTAEALREHTKNHIGGYKAPRSVEFVEALPVSPAGKILKRELRARYWPTRHAKSTEETPRSRVCIRSTLRGPHS